MRSPKYLDIDLLRQMADYFGIAVATEGQVTRRVLDTTDRGVGINRGVQGRADRTATEEITECYQSELRPVKLFNDIIDELLVSDRVADLTQGTTAQVIHRRPLMVEGEIEVAPASEVGDILAKFMPLLTGMIAEGRTDFNPSQQELAQQFVAGEHVKSPYVMRMEAEDDDGQDFYFVLDPDKIASGFSIDDLVGELTIFGLAEKIVREGGTYSLDRYAVPGINRTFRRAMGKDAVRNLMNSTRELRGSDSNADASDLDVHGPAVIVQVVGIFS
ncbi:DUF6414 family protein [Pseudonocardia alni]|jgi:hypothetical protein|uniref:DUF6414 family protein n=1 Tax=Pseudonocardia alni TaxID=33907 RepID=UPI003401921B